MSPGTSRWILSLAALCVAGVLASFFLLHKSPQPTVDLVRSKATQAGLYRVTIAPEVEPLRTGVLHSWVLILATPDGKPVEGARITVDGGMPSHGHGLPTSPEATGYLGEGRYRIEGVKFNMGGLWELKFAVSAAAGDDRVTFNLRL